MGKTDFTPLQFDSWTTEESAPDEAPEQEWLGDLGTPRGGSGDEPFHAGLDLRIAPAQPAAPAASPPPEAPAEGEAEEGASGPTVVDPEELERLREQARKEGYDAGLLEGREKGEAEGREAMERVQSTFMDSFEQALKTLTEGQPESLGHWQQPLEQIVREVSERVLRKALEDDLRGYLERLVHAALEEIDAGTELRVTLGNVTPGLVEEMRERLQGVPGMENLRLHMEPEHPEDFVRVETDYGVIQTALESQLDRVVAQVTEAAQEDE